MRLPKAPALPYTTGLSMTEGYPMTTTDATRPDLYRIIHKGLRLGHCQLLARLGSACWADETGSAALLDELRAHLALSRAHLEHEDAAIHPCLSEAAETLARLEQEHGHHLEQFRGLDSLARKVADAKGTARAQGGHELYLAFARFVAADFLHMEREEQEIMPLLWLLLSDDAISGIHGRIVTAIPPLQMVAYLRLILPAISTPERLAMLKAMQADAPAAVFAEVLEKAAKPSLPLRDWQSLASDLGVAA